jgi:hypothetical protein
LAILIACGAIAASASGRSPVPLAERGKGAQHVVVGRNVGLEARMATNAYGDQLIVSRVLVQVEETLKGEDVPFVSVDVEGGTLSGVTLRVSDLPEVRQDERAVYFLGAARNGVHTPHLRGQGILKLGEDGVVPGTSLHLDEIRRVVVGASR